MFQLGFKNAIRIICESGIGTARNMSLTSSHSAKYRNNKNYPFHKKYRTSIKEIESEVECDIELNEISPKDVVVPKELIHQDLNIKIWDENKQLRREVRKKLLKIAKEFYENIGIKPTIKHVYMIGSMANYNWSSKSDIDLHIFFDFSEVSNNRELVEQFFWAKKSLWNLKHDIKIRGFDVEIYCNDINDKNYSSGVYDIYHNHWVNEPQIENFTIDNNAIKTKLVSLINQIEDLQNNKKQTSQEKHDNALKLKEKLANMRQSGLEQGGEFSLENISFKYLRNNGYLDTLYSIAKQTFDDNLSLK